MRTGLKTVTQPPGGHRCHQEHTPPDQALPEVVRVPGVSPEAAIHDPALVGGIGQEASKLSVRRHLHAPAQRPETGPQEVQEGQARWNLRTLAHLRG